MEHPLDVLGLLDFLEWLQTTNMHIPKDDAGKRALIWAWERVRQGDEAVICSFMEARPLEENLVSVDDGLVSVGGWWQYEPPSIVPVKLTWERLLEAETKLTEAQWSALDKELKAVQREIGGGKGNWYPWHVTVDQKVRALAAVLRASR